jgi:single-strand DNA-binding protein
MSRCVNSVILLGNCGNAPEIRYTASGKVLAKLSLAVNESFKNSHGEWQERTHWVSIVAWQRLAEIVGEYVLRGTRLYVQGRLNTESWDDRRSGQKRYRMSVVAERLIVLEHARQRNDATKPSAPQKPAPVGTSPVSSDS